MLESAFGAHIRAVVLPAAAVLKRVRFGGREVEAFVVEVEAVLEELAS
jgi:hypothetical protein